MKRSAPERNFDLGLRSMQRGNLVEALAYFEACLRLDDRLAHSPRRARYISYYGYCLAAAIGRTREGRELCNRAASSEFFSPEIYLNLARVEILAGDRRKAWNALVRGLSLDPGHRGIRTEMKKMGLRRRPVLSFLDRAHPVNRAAGRLTSRVGSQGSRGGSRPSGTRHKKKKTT
jgi:tetratricopeptide (TPR) repeat protein